MAGEAIFIGYRRDDTADVAGRIYDAMAQRFGRQRIFKDVDNIGPGLDFGDYIKTVLPRCRVVLILIGPHWLNAADDSGRRRIDDEHDWVRIEIETALRTPDLLVVPVLVNGASMPRAEDVPESLKPLLRRNAAIIRRDPDFHDDVERLATALRASVNTGILDLSKIGGRASDAHKSPRNDGGGRASLLIGGAIVAALVLAAIGYGASQWLPLQGARTTDQEIAAAEPVSQTPPEATSQAQGEGAGPRSDQRQVEAPPAQEPEASSTRTAALQTSTNGTARTSSQTAISCGQLRSVVLDDGRTACLVPCTSDRSACATTAGQIASEICPGDVDWSYHADPETRTLLMGFACRA